MAIKRANGEGSIRKKTIKGNIYWEGRYTDSQNKQRSVSGKTQYEVREKMKMAQRKAAVEIEEQKALENGEVYYDKNMTLNEWYEIYMNRFAGNLKPQTKYVHEMQYKSAFKDTIGNKTMKYISEETLLDLIVTLKNKGLSINTINTYFQFLNSLFNKALDKRIINTNPSKPIKIKTENPKKPKRALTLEEIDLLLKITNEKRSYLTPLFIFLLHTGCRIGEAISLEWQDVSLDMKFCTITKNRTSYNNEKGVYIATDSTPKNKTSERKIPIDDELKLMLQELKDLRKKQGQFNKDKKIFLSKMFHVMYATYIDKQLKEICNYIQEHCNKDFPDVTSHWFRHTFTSRGIEKNVPMFYLQKIGGWANMNMISKVYGHMNDVQALESINNIYGNNN